MAKDKYLIAKERCSVTMFDMHVSFSRDGRERGIWIFLEDSKRGEANLPDIDKLIIQYLEYLKVPKKKHFGALMKFSSLFQHMMPLNMCEGALIEWPQMEKMYQKLGGAMWQARAKQILEEDSEAERTHQAARKAPKGARRRKRKGSKPKPSVGSRTHSKAVRKGRQVRASKSVKIPTNPLGPSDMNYYGYGSGNRGYAFGGPVV